MSGLERRGEARIRYIGRDAAHDQYLPGPGIGSSDSKAELRIVIVIIVV